MSPRPLFPGAPGAKERPVDPVTPANRFRSCLLVAPASAETFSCVRALHSAGIAVLARTPGSSTISMALSGEFDIIAWVWEPGSTATTEGFGRVAAADIPILALVP